MTTDNPYESPRKAVTVGGKSRWPIVMLLVATVAGVCLLLTAFLFLAWPMPAPQTTPAVPAHTQQQPVSAEAEPKEASVEGESR